MRFADIPRSPEARVLRQFALLWLVLVAALALWQYLAGGGWLVAAALGLLAATVGLAGLARPALVRPVFVGWLMLTFPLGWLVSHAVLAIVYYLLITPLGLAMQCCGRDPLRLRRPVGADSYWQARGQSDEARRHLRQY